MFFCRLAVSASTSGLAPSHLTEPVRVPSYLYLLCGSGLSVSPDAATLVLPFLPSRRLCSGSSSLSTGPPQPARTTENSAAERITAVGPNGNRRMESSLEKERTKREKEAAEQ